MLDRTNRALNKRARKVSTEYGAAMETVTKTRIRQKVEETAKRVDELPIALDDGIPPRTPANVTAEALRRAIRVRWSDPLEEEYVERSRVRVTNTMTTGRVIVQEQGRGSSATVIDLPPEEHLVEVQHVDQFGLASPWSAWVSVTPSRSVADEIDLAAARISGKLGWTNMSALTDASNLGDDVVTSRAMATQNFAALSAWIQSAAIEDALIADLRADKITTGTLSVQIELDVDGAISWPGGLLDDGGMILGNLAKGAGALPHTSPASWITSMDDGEIPSPASGMTFFRGADSGEAYRGALIVAQGVRNDPSRNGMIRLLATTGSTDPGIAASADITIKSRSGGGFVALKHDLVIERDLNAGRNLQVGNTLGVGGNATVSGVLNTEHMSWRSTTAVSQPNVVAVWTHGFGTASLIVEAQFLQDGFWRPIENNGSGLIVYWDATAVRIENTLSGNRSVRIAAAKMNF